MNSNNKALKYLLNIDMVIACLALVFIIAITFVGVIMRYAFNSPFVWQEEVQLWCFVWVIFLGAGAAFRTGSHVAIEFLVDLMPAPMKKAFEVLIYIAVMGILIFFTIHGAGLINQIIGMGSTTNILKIPYSVIYSVFPIGCVIMMINYTIVAGNQIFNKKIGIEVAEDNGN